ncbi:MAG: hypothetical protein A2312_03290 [Candidatus Staskawiczbacteria bacterium RIFOXYB2_FULL_32_9]|uniref:Uncharacterized protein n=1 Tax=Candidatus Staskawiczbacteria bacterium RIFOXYD1_FULL_32_13 TaxID=1802234 RepID=A0A1G2JMS2_9BACT|nr:MAG: hypothetical protein UR22_C0029G0010 [Parcubacteria group bacterium GW2011_GWC2_32_10]OGZ78784.1 MAG: hypothetical protein A2360_00645 [Candidatus Staskawiczbacteria bacterium RIFOXYB1_FULL_32_11]OGZ83286.1 MAG: hypothetical protein A2312_03290 [Candidatus Staskawiczbacteria bacterium RIFOXYB2_FULL_32_9]OGZ87341.1 MAG: hypothetical protein A2463_01165 [Candidatus Staskawiczbacteria bacterium RIFOXYC2_FULL_32_10]OGZ88253.1 MAG: hypothetical protein A2561_04840 [Candidatus Staskawiczbacte
MEFITIIIYFIFLLASVLVPDVYILSVKKFLTNKVKELSTVKTESEKLFDIPQVLGWTERTLYYLFLAFFINQFAIFLGIWLALKTIVTFKDWQAQSTVTKKAKAGSGNIVKAKFSIFLIGNGLSIISVILFFFLAKAILGF